MLNLIIRKKVWLDGKRNKSKGVLQFDAISSVVALLLVLELVPVLAIVLQTGI